MLQDYGVEFPICEKFSLTKLLLTKCPKYDSKSCSQNGGVNDIYDFFSKKFFLSKRHIMKKTILICIKN